MAKYLYSVWLVIAVLTAVAFILPLPMRGTILLALGVIHGRLLARFV